MKIKYHQWTCIGCGQTIRFTGKNIFSALPYWFTIRTEGCVSSSERPSFDTCACSTACLEKAGKIIEDFIKNHPYRIPTKKSIESTICDQCGKVEEFDKLNPLFGGRDPLEDWTWEKNSKGRKDFCSDECKKNHLLHPEESVFAGLKFDNPWDEARLIQAIGSPDFKEAIKPRKIRFTRSKSIREALSLSNLGAKKKLDQKKSRSKKPKSES